MGIRKGLVLTHPLRPPLPPSPPPALSSPPGQCWCLTRWSPPHCPGLLSVPGVSGPSLTGLPVSPSPRQHPASWSFRSSHTGTILPFSTARVSIVDATQAPFARGSALPPCASRMSAGRQDSVPRTAQYASVPSSIAITAAVLPGARLPGGVPAVDPRVDSTPPSEPFQARSVSFPSPWLAGLSFAL